MRNKKGQMTIGFFAIFFIIGIGLIVMPLVLNSMINQDTPNTETNNTQNDNNKVEFNTTPVEALTSSKEALTIFSLEATIW